MDVKTAFLNGLLDEDIYMVQPDGYTDEERPDYVCHLKRSLYGLKQSPRMWNQTIDKFMLELEFKKCKADHCIYAKWNDQDMIFVLSKKRLVQPRYTSKPVTHDLHSRCL
ncbi:unnamed protein product [Phytophthora lilii]|uniref:Unnamed protein product n=1 Tax=Phytophthora lilii TaxID=2077276 RepID=A0A9W6XJI2_9STRA|nr:unnamed protein product [Phytophthora lilii]